ncbi:MAG: acyltransferase [Eubacterium sp.]|nr:acyltransferase [Eubacterium sp.]
MDDSKKRINSIDIARGIAMISIVLGHLGNSDINRIVFTYHIPIFYLITGYFIDEKSSSKRFLWRKIRTLIFPYIFSCFLVICSAVFMNIKFDNGVETKKVVRTWVLASLYGAGGRLWKNHDVAGIGALWFILATFWGVIILRLILHCNKYVRVLLVLGLFELGIVTSHKLFWFPLSIQPGLCSVLYMYIGYLIKKASENQTFSQIWNNKEIRFFLFLFALKVELSFIDNFQSFWIVQCDYGKGFIDIMASLCGCYILIVISRIIDDKIHIIGKGFAYLGKHSIYFLTAHIIELNTFYWYRLAISLVGPDITEPQYLRFRIALKFLWIIPITILLSKIKIIRKIYGSDK